MPHRLAPLSLVLLATMLALAPQSARADRAAPWPNLQGEAALAHLRREGLDGSLVEIDDSGARFPVTIDSIFTQQAYLKASNTEAFDQFGVSMAISGDTLVVGAFAEDSNATGVNGDPSNNSAPGAGAVYVFVRSAGAWSQQAYLKASNTEAFDNFGVSVAISGDTLVVGANGESSNATGVDGNQSNNSVSSSGAVYVFVRNAGAWSQQAYLKASNTDADDQFGGSVAISGDTLVVGAVGEDSNATGVDGDSANNSASNAGAAYVFVRSAGAWSQQAYLKASNTDALDSFGISVAISGDTLVVGANGESSNATGVNGNQSNNLANASGASYVFVRNAGAWSQQAYLKASNTGADDLFGGSVAISGDTLVVGASDEDGNATGVNGDQANNSANEAGASYVFVRSAGAWSQQAYLKASNTDEGDFFGGSVAISGDTLVVGAYGESSNATGVDGDQANNSALLAGAAYVFMRSAGVWSQQAYLKASNTGAGDLFGLSVAIAGDTLVVGASGEDSNATGVNGDQANNSVSSSGAAYVFVDRTGYYTLPPCRLVDTRLADGPLGGPALAAHVARDFVLAGTCGVPATAVAVVLTVTAVGSTAAGRLQIYPTGSTPLADGGIVHYRAGVTRAGNGILALGAGGAVSALAEQPTGTVHLVLDVTGYFLGD